VILIQEGTYRQGKLVQLKNNIKSIYVDFIGDSRESEVSIDQLQRIIDKIDFYYCNLFEYLLKQIVVVEFNKNDFDFDQTIDKIRNIFLESNANFKNSTLYCHENGIQIDQLHRIIDRLDYCYSYLFQYLLKQIIDNDFQKLNTNIRNNSAQDISNFFFEYNYKKDCSSRNSMLSCHDNKPFEDWR